jgi:hypothetical protein
MSRILIALLLSLTVGAVADAAKTAKGPSDPQDWRLPTGLPPSRAEFAALVAACQDKVQSTSDSGKIDACLVSEFGMRRAP